MAGYYIIARPVQKDEQLETVREKVDVNIKNMYGRQNGFIYGLQKYTDYRISVTGFTHKGTGPESESKKIKTLEDGKWSFYSFLL